MYKLKNITVSILFGSVPEKFVVDEFVKALERHYTLWALASLDELIRREKSGLIACALESAFEKGQLHEGSPFVKLLAEALEGDCKRDKHLRSYGQSLLAGEFFPPSVWATKRYDECLMAQDADGARDVCRWARNCGVDSPKKVPTNHPNHGQLLEDLRLEQHELH